MRFSVVAILATAGLVAAQTATSVAGSQTSSTCAAQNIVEACKSTTKLQVDACGPNDYQCLCNAYTNVLTCYDNCPGDPNRYGTSQQQLANCNAAKQLSSMSAATATTSGSASATDASSAAASTMATVTSSAAASSSASASAKASSTGLAGHVVVPAAGGLLAIVMGIANLI